MGDIREKHIKIEASDHFLLAATLFYPDATPISKSIVLGSALGVPRYIYFKLARFLADRELAVLVFDYRGVHESQSDQVSGSDMRMYDWGKLDIDAALEWALDKWNPDELIYLAHSCGGQLLGLAPHSIHIDKAVFIASQTGYWKTWPNPYRWGVLAVWNLIPLITPWFDDFPARTLRLSSVNIPSGVARQWAEWGKSPNYLWDFIVHEDLDRYKQLSVPLLSLGFSDDLYFGPPSAVEKLLSYYPSVNAGLRIISPSDYNRKSIGHFGFLKEDFRNTLWNELVDWLNKTIKF
jgi:predicted alpha/beta hydrolase